MKRTEINLDTIYALTHTRVTRPAIILSTEPHELHRASGTSTEPSTYRLDADSGIHRSYGQVTGRSYGRHTTHRGLPALVAHGRDADEKIEGLRLLAGPGVKGFLGVLGNGQAVGDGITLEVLRPQDVVQPWVDHVAQTQADAEKRRADKDRIAAEREQAEQAHLLVDELLDTLGVTVTPPLMGGPTREGVDVFRGAAWESLYALLAKVAEAGAAQPEMARRLADAARAMKD